jgi:mono/diheme cytochrome c family protein
MNPIRTLLLCLALATPVAGRADERSIRMMDGPERVLLAANCSGCHSLDYIQMNSPFLKRAGWEAEVKKMIAVMGAPVSDADATTLVGYLAREYGIPD